jgi:hypothetical protein
MEYNEVTYVETWGSLPPFYPVLRYFHMRSGTAKDFEGVGPRTEVVPVVEFLVQMSERYKGDNKKLARELALIKGKRDDL